MRKLVFAATAAGILVALSIAHSASAAVTYSYTGTDVVWDLSFNYTAPTPIDQDSSAMVPCTDNHGDTSCILDFYLAGTPNYQDPFINANVGPDATHDIIEIHSDGGGALGCCISYGLALDAGALTHNGVYQSLFGRGPVTVSGILPAASGTPEPAAWALMILGFGGVGAALRRRQSVEGRRPAAA